MRFVLPVLCATLLCPAAAQEDDSAWRRMLESKRQVKAYLEKSARELTDRAAAEIQSAESWERVKARRVEEMRDMLGLLPWPARTPLHPRITGVLDKSGYTVEKLAFESMPKLYVTANLYIPKNRSDDFGNVVVETGHADSTFLRERAITWFDRHLMKAGDRKLDLDYSDAAPETLAVFSGKPPANAVNYRVHETFTTRPAAVEVPSSAAWAKRAGELLATLRAKVFHALPSQPPKLERLGTAKISGFDEHRFTGPDAVDIRIFTKRVGTAEGKLPALLYVASDSEDPRAINDTLAGVNRRDAAVVMVVYPRGIGEVPWDKTFWKDTLRNAMHVGETVDSMRLKDVMAAALALRQLDGVDTGRVLVAGKGVSGALGLYAAILDPQISQVLLMEPPVSHRQGPIFLNVMRYTDLPEAAALLAPRRLNFYGHMPQEFEYTRRVYAAAGKADHVFLTMSIEGILQGRYNHDFASGL